MPQLRHQSTNSLPDPSANQAQPNQSESASESASGSTSETASEPASDSSNPVSPADRIKTVPHYEIVFTCKPCGTRSKHRISKQGYHHGSILISCPGCRNRHVISDHLRIFGDRALTVEDLMKERGQLVKKGTLGEDGDLEFWEDGTVTERNADSGEEVVNVAERKEQEEEGRERWRENAPGSTFKKDQE